jgi:fructokinase
VKDIVCFGELLWDMLPSGKVAGGAPFNIANRAKALGADAVVISSIGKDYLGDQLLELVSSKGNNVDYIQGHPDLLTGTVDVQVGANGEPHYHIVHPVAWDDIKLTDELIDLVKTAKCFVYSSLGLRDIRSREVLFALLPYASLKVCDINLRDGHYTKDTILRMIEHADILRMNEHELTMVALWLNLEIGSFEDGVTKLAQKYGFRAVVATLGGDGAISYSNGKFYRQPVFAVEVRDTVGAGDAFLASYLKKILDGASEIEALKYGCAIGALTASKVGGTPDITQKEIDDILATS